MALQGDNVIYEVANSSEHQPLNQAVGRRHEFKRNSLARESSVLKWQCIATGYYVFVLVGCVCLIGYSVYQMYVEELFDILLNSLNISNDVKLSKELPPLSLLCDQIMLSVGIVSSMLVLCGIMGSHKKKRVYITGAGVLLFLIGTVAGAIGISLYVSLDEFIAIFPIGSPIDYGSNNQTTQLLDEIQVKLSCCGRRGFSDYQANQCFDTANNLSSISCYPQQTVSSVLPLSCCIDRNKTNCNTGKSPGNPNHPFLIHEKGCVSLIEDSATQRFKVVTALLLSLCLLILLSLPNVCCLHLAITRQKDTAVLHERMSSVYSRGHMCNHTGTCHKKYCRHSFPVVSPTVIHHQTSRPNIQKVHIKDVPNFDNIIITDRTHLTHMPHGVRHVQSHDQSHDHPRYSSYHHNQNQNYNIMSNANTDSNVRIPMSALLDPDTEMSDGGDLPFDRLLVVPIQNRQHKHRVRSAAFFSQNKLHNAEDINLTLEPDDGLAYYNGSLYHDMSTRPAPASLPRYSSIEWTSRNDDSDASSLYELPRYKTSKSFVGHRGGRRRKMRMRRSRSGSIRRRRRRRFGRRRML